MNNRQTYPFVVAYGYSNAAWTTFLLPGKEVTIEGANELIPIILPLCNGRRTIDDIVSATASESDYTEKDIRHLIQVLIKRQVLVDVNSYYRLFHDVSANPLTFFQYDSSEEVVAEMVKKESPLFDYPHDPRSNLEALLEKRESVREFSGEALSKNEIVRLGWVIYGKQKRSTSFPESTIGLGTIPSGGALYSLRLYAIVLKNHSSIQKGIYLFGSKGVEKLAGLSKKKLEDAFGGYSAPIESTAVIFVLTCEFQQVIQKYSNRGYRYALIEAGHAAQNAYLWCAEQKLGVLEVCGFSDKALAKAISIYYPAQAPLTTIFIGRFL